MNDVWGSKFNDVSQLEREVPKSSSIKFLKVLFSKLTLIIIEINPFKIIIIVINVFHPYFFTLKKVPMGGYSVWRRRCASTPFVIMSFFLQYSWFNAWDVEIYRVGLERKERKKIPIIDDTQTSLSFSSICSFVDKIYMYI